MVLNHAICIASFLEEDTTESVSKLIPWSGVFERGFSLGVPKRHEATYKYVDGIFCDKTHLAVGSPMQALRRWGCDNTWYGWYRIYNAGRISHSIRSLRSGQGGPHLIRTNFKFVDLGLRLQSYSFFTLCSLFANLFFCSLSSSPNCCFMVFFSVRLACFSCLTVALRFFLSSVDSLRGLVTVWGAAKSHD